MYESRLRGCELLKSGYNITLAIRLMGKPRQTYEMEKD